MINSSPEEENQAQQDVAIKIHHGGPGTLQSLWLDCPRRGPGAGGPPPW